VATNHTDRALIERVLGRPLADSEQARWGFTNSTTLITLADGDRVVLQRYGRRQDAAYRLRVMRSLQRPAADAGIVIPDVRASDLDAEPPWAIFDVLPGVPVPEAGDVGLDGALFPAMARAMGELLAELRGLPTAGLELNDLWADPERLSDQATSWIEKARWLNGPKRATLRGLVRRLPPLFADRPVVLAHGDFAPVNVLTDGKRVTGLLDFESVRLADPIFDVAWWAWAVSFGEASALERGWLPFLEGAGIDSTDPMLSARVHALQVLRMLELTVGETSIGPEIRSVVTDRLREMLQ
jgi:aminoglycoside phosphotransferase (APT) family kinase protein